MARWPGCSSASSAFARRAIGTPNYGFPKRIAANYGFRTRIGAALLASLVAVWFGTKSG
jgi:hypothetical protein